MDEIITQLKEVIENLETLDVFLIQIAEEGAYIGEDEEEEEEEEEEQDEEDEEDPHVKDENNKRKSITDILKAKME